VREVIEYMAERWPQGGRWEVNGRADLHEATTLRLDSTLARIQLGWRPLVSTPRAIDMTIDWFVDVDRGNDAKACCLEQIHEHTRLERGADPDEMTSRTPQ
jgi:CDP-glucose 4,6-dehydratase